MLLQTELPWALCRWFFPQTWWYPSLGSFREPLQGEVFRSCSWRAGGREGWEVTFSVTSLHYFSCMWSKNPTASGAVSQCPDVVVGFHCVSPSLGLLVISAVIICSLKYRKKDTAIVLKLDLVVARNSRNALCSCSSFLLDWKESYHLVIY